MIYAERGTEEKFDMTILDEPMVYERDISVMCR